MAVQPRETADHMLSGYTHVLHTVQVPVGYQDTSWCYRNTAEQQAPVKYHER